ncbi:transcription termination factor Rho [Collinsella sp. KGMB02528]|uniref:Transcription termination factor Rho n=2 Tax=Collinsella acetigenes TaxID=2713419 RepID=A0A7X9UDE0_9ACTN|nr:transcription termination factor Rho [Collinsella acetigenes]NMF56440.1 transcription termination factor Rho [Collinsella acetigenes]
MQAQVVRDERQRQEREVEVLVGDAPAAPKKTTRRRKAADIAKPVDSEKPSEAFVPAEASASAVEEPARPARRTRKPKVDKASAGKEGAEGSSNEAPASDNSEEKDVRPGRARRTRKATATSQEASQDDSPSPSEKTNEQDTPAPKEEKEPEGAKQAEEPKAAKLGKGDESKDASGKKDVSASEGDASTADSSDSARGDKRRKHQNKREHAERNDRNGDRRNGRQQNRKQRGNNRYAAPLEPSLSREELTAMKVAELREKGKELDLDVAGKKKAELVEEIYVAAARAEGFRDIQGILDITNEGFGYIRAHGYMPSRDDAFVPLNMIRAARLRPGDVIEGTLRPSRANDKFPGLAKIRTINGKDPEEMRHRPKFSELTPIYPNEPLKMEHGRDSITGRAIDIVSPIGKGQRGLIVSPPKAGKTTILKKICQSIAANNPEVYLICLLVDERPEEVTDMERSIKGDVVASTFDMPADNHTRVSELVIERAKRIVEMGGDVVVVLDSITRLARAYNLAAPASGRILSGGVDSAALYPPKRFLGAARNIENGGSLTILASALIDTGSKMDEVIFEEFKGTGNMELKLDRDLADRRIFPAIDPVASGTRNEDLLIDESTRPFVWGIRRILANMNNTERSAAAFIKGLKGTNSNEEFLIRSAKKAADHEASL